MGSHSNVSMVKRQYRQIKDIMPVFEKFNPGMPSDWYKIDAKAKDYLLNSG